MLGLGFQGGFLCNSSMTLLSRVSAVRSPVYVTLKRQQLRLSLLYGPLLLHYQPGLASCRSIPQQGHLGMPAAPPHILRCLLLAEMVPAGEENLLFYHAGG